MLIGVETGDTFSGKNALLRTYWLANIDVLCVQFQTNILVSSTIGRNKNLIPGEVISAYHQRQKNSCNTA